MAVRQFTKKDRYGKTIEVANRYVAEAHTTLVDPDTGRRRKTVTQLGAWYSTKGGGRQAVIHFDQAVEVARAAGADDPIHAARVCLFGERGRATKAQQRDYRPTTPPPDFAAAFGETAAQTAFGSRTATAPTGMSAVLLSASGRWAKKCAEDRLDRMILTDELLRRYDEHLAERARNAEPTKRKAAHRTHVGYMRGLSDFLDFFGGMPAEMIPRISAVAWARMPNYAWKAATVARMYTWARDEAGLVNDNPFAGLGARKTPDRSGRTLSAADLDRVRDACFEIHGPYGQDVFAMVLLAAVCGLRMQEICALQWSWIDAEEGFITVERQLYEDRIEGEPKHREPGDERDLAPMPAQARRHILALPRRLRLKDGEATSRVLLSKTGLELTAALIDTYWEPVREATGIDIPFKDLRDTFFTDMFKRRIHPTLIALLGRHRDGGVTAIRNYEKLERRETFLDALPELERPVPARRPRRTRDDERRAS